ncbi:hypothetical protein [Flavobacterium aurantiibacter]|uniref:Uncharacterized protein n=1 Tax=Flavobacterium aurantiibacter TaxID=2023067 RepID=A0A256AC21_9FLAO|nr:hypothetical protein [Flavobacterium aurantiibacter]OYQ51257.1 hypothetical protein CHX27_00415 [Flavobacterium aurantiibacter]
MKKKTIIALSLLGFVLFLFIRVQTFDYVGLYVLRNYAGNIEGEVPKNSDTLKIYPNFKFESSYYGKGSYKIKKEVLEEAIQFIYKYEFGLAGIEMRVERNFLTSNVKLIVSTDQEIYYERID